MLIVARLIVNIAASMLEGVLSGRRLGCSEFPIAYSGRIGERGEACCGRVLERVPGRVEEMPLLAATESDIIATALGAILLVIVLGVGLGGLYGIAFWAPYLVAPKVTPGRRLLIGLLGVAVLTFAGHFIGGLLPDARPRSPEELLRVWLGDLLWEMPALLLLRLAVLGWQRLRAKR